MKSSVKIRKPLTKQQRIALWEKYNRKCAYCGCNLEYKHMQVDHIESIFRAEYKSHYQLTNDEISKLNDEENLLPTCRQCNFYKNVHTLEEFRADLTEVLMKNLRNTFQFRLAVKHGLVTDNHKEKIQFYFEKIKN